jgi:REP element-mobilizing transposase RayT
MSSTHLSLHVHIVFSTKNRFPFIIDEWRERLHSFLGGAIRTAACIPEAVGGTNDHVHVLIGIRATHRLADVVRDIKHASSKWVHETIGNQKFAWQDGYGAFTIGASQIDIVKSYIARQPEHHRKRTFQDEYVTFLDRYRVEYDNRFLW